MRITIHSPISLNGNIWQHADMAERFMTLTDVAELLNITASQTYALVRSGELPAIKIGGRGQWRVEAQALEDYIARMYEVTASFVAAHPLTSSSES
jgi:excisionase family DNA binding protein